MTRIYRTVICMQGQTSVQIPWKKYRELREFEVADADLNLALFAWGVSLGSAPYVRIWRQTACRCREGKLRRYGCSTRHRRRRLMAICGAALEVPEGLLVGSREQVFRLHMSTSKWSNICKDHKRLEYVLKHKRWAADVVILPSANDRTFQMR